VQPQISIPGCSSETAPTRVQSHVSHVQVVKQAMSSAIPGTQQEMWPLMLLDLIDKRRPAPSAAHAHHPQHKRSTAHQVNNKNSVQRTKISNAPKPSSHQRQQSFPSQQQHLHHKPVRRPGLSAAMSSIGYSAEQPGTNQHRSDALAHQTNQQERKKAARAVALAPAARMANAKGSKIKPSSQHRPRRDTVPSAYATLSRPPPVNYAPAASPSHPVSSQNGHVGKTPLGGSPMHVQSAKKPTGSSHSAPGRK